MVVVRRGRIPPIPRRHFQGILVRAPDWMDCVAANQRRAVLFVQRLLPGGGLGRCRQCPKLFAQRLQRTIGDLIAVTRPIPRKQSLAFVSPTRIRESLIP